jgi:hypothetical protein
MKKTKGGWSVLPAAESFLEERICLEIFIA